MFSPRKRRCFHDGACGNLRSDVFSAQAEVFLYNQSGRKPKGRFLRASGGVSTQKLNTLNGWAFSPRKRRCFSEKARADIVAKVFSAQAEVFQLLSMAGQGAQSFLRASGGVSKKLENRSKQGGFSPRKRRCFRGDPKPGNGNAVFSAQAEVFLNLMSSSLTSIRFLRASGGVS